MTRRSMWMLEYAHCLVQPVGCAFYGQWNAGTMPFAYSFVYAEVDDRKVLIDCGHDISSSNAGFHEANNITDYQFPSVVLAKVGVSAEEIDTVILTHAHYDHAGAMRLFPNATFYLQKVEIESSKWALDNAHLYGSILGALDPEDVALLDSMAENGRVVLLDGPVEDFLPGVSIRTAFDGHTMGGQYVVLQDHNEQNWVVTGDCLYSYQNAEGVGGSGPPVNIGFGGGSAWRGLQIIAEMAQAAGAADRLVIVHEPDTFRRKPSRLYPDNLSVAELVLAPDSPSRIALG
jgi:N-acyl homoserine lactone hydrolase